uniref:Uncharacterized protein n=1 Tax=Myripristis murdjan TaxID=586833 RepID=A0A667XCH3_9TELE
MTIKIYLSIYLSTSCEEQSVLFSALFLCVLTLRGAPLQIYRPMVYQAAAASVSRINQLNPGPRLYRASHATVRLNRSHELLLELVVRETQCGRALMRQLDRCAIRPGPAVVSTHRHTHTHTHTHTALCFHHFRGHYIDLYSFPGDLS